MVDTKETPKLSSAIFSKPALPNAFYAPFARPSSAFLGNSDVVLATGFEKMRTGSLENMKELLPDRTHSQVNHLQVIKDTYGIVKAPITCQMFGNAGREHMEKYGLRSVAKMS